MQAKASGELLGWGCVQDECATDLAHFLTVCCQRSVGGLHVCVCACMEGMRRVSARPG